MFKNYKDCLFNGGIILKSQQRFKSDHHKVYTEEVRSHYVVMVIRDYKYLMGLKHTHTEQMRLKNAKAKLW